MEKNEKESDGARKPDRAPSADDPAGKAIDTFVLPRTEVDAANVDVTHVGATHVGADSALASAGYLAIGGVFAGRYEILEILGEGGMGRVYKVRDVTLDRLVALKTIRSDVADAEMLERFKQELVLARGITHKNVVRIHDLGEAGGVQYITMEYIEGQSLKDRIEEKGRLDADEAVPILLAVLSALEEAHEQGVVHRDLKPPNIMLDRRGVPYIMDFGIARSDQRTGMTATGSVLGTPHYMSPEQATGEKVGPASDLYSLGIIMYEMMTGELPFRGETPVSQIMARLRERPRPPRQIDGSIPPYLEAVILKCLETDPELRYGSAAEVRSDLQEEQLSRTFGEYTLRMQKAMRRRWPLVAAVALAAAGLGVAVFTATRTPEDVASGVEEALGGDDFVATVALLPLANTAGNATLDWMRDGLPEMLITDLAQSRYVLPVGAARVHRLLGEMGVEDQKSFDEATLETVARLAPADYVVHGRFFDEGDQLRLDLTLWQAAAKMGLPLRFDGTRENVFQLVDAISDGVKQELELTPEQRRGDTDRPVSEVATDSVEALIAYQEGLAALRSGSYQAAVAGFEASRSADPEFAMADAKLAEAYLYSGNPREADAAIARAQRRAQELELPLAQRYQMNAVAGLVAGDYQLAADNLKQLAEIYPADPDILLQLAQAYEEVGSFDAAQQAYEKVTELAPGYGAALLGLGRVQVTSGQHLEAIRSLQAALAGDGLAGDLEAQGMAHSILGVAHREIGKLDEAIEYLQRSRQLRHEIGDVRGEAVTLFNLASIHEYRGDIEAALRAERQAKEMGEEMGDDVVVSQALSNMGLTYKTAGDLPKALAAYEESLRIEMTRGDHSDEVNRLNQIAEIHRLMGEYDLAVILLERARAKLEEFPHAQELAINLNFTGKVKKSQGEYAEAIAAFLEALPMLQQIHQAMGVAAVHNNLGQIYLDQGRYADSLAALRKSFEIYAELHVEHDLAEVQAPLAHLLLEVGMLDEAAAALEAAEHAAHGAHAEGVMPEILLGRARLDHLAGRRRQAAEAIRAFNFQANLSRQKEVAVASRIELSLLYLEEGELDVAQRLATRTREEAEKAGLRPLQAAAHAALAEILLARGRAEESRVESLEAIALARQFSGRPILVRSYVTLAGALEALGRDAEALDSYGEAASILDWTRDALLPEHRASYLGREDVRRLVDRTIDALESGGRASNAAGLRQWVESQAAG